MKMNILVTLDSNYVAPLCTMLESMLLSDSDCAFDVYVAHSSLSEHDFRKIRKTCVPYGARIISVKIPDYLFDGAPRCKRITKETYYRIFAPLYLPKELDRILYIDPDTLILNSVKGLYNINFGSACFAGAGHFDGIINQWNKFRLNMKHSKVYINAGVLMINLKELRKDFSEQRIFDFIAENERSLFLADQDVINKFYDGRIISVDPFLFNLDERTFKKELKNNSVEQAFEKVEKVTSIIHYDGKYKPWKAGYKGFLNAFYKQTHFSKRESGYAHFIA